MTATRTSRRASRRSARPRKAVPRRGAKPAVKTVSKLTPPPQVLFRLCRAGWAVTV